MLAVLLLAGPPPASRAFAEPNVPGFVVSTYASVTNPEELPFDAVGNLYVGNDDDVNRITRIGPGGTPIVAYGNDPIVDPDAVLFDATGAISGAAGAILVGGGADIAATTGQIKAILADQSVTTIFGPTTVFRSPTKMAFDSTGRLLFTDPLRGQGTGQIFASPGAFPVPLASVPGDPIYLAIDATDHIFTTTDSGTLLIYNADGTVANPNFASGLGNNTPLAFGPGGAFGQEL